MTSERMFIGCYSAPIGTMKNEGEGIVSCLLDTNTGEFSDLKLSAVTINPSYLITTKNNSLFCIQEAFAGQQPVLSRYYINGDGELNHCQDVSMSGEFACHLAIDPQGEFVTTAQYGSGSFELFPLNKNNDLGPACDLIQHQGSGPNLDRQEGPHGHHISFLNHSDTLVTVDLGIDTIGFYPFDRSQGKILSQQAKQVELPKGCGPRHVIFTKDETTAFVLCELSEEVIVLRHTQGQWKITMRCQPFEPHNLGGATAAIRLSADERFIYVSGRHQAQIACLEVDSHYSLRLVERTSTLGLFPRDFNLSANDKWLVVANQNSHNVVSFERNPTSGKLTTSGHQFETGSPVCIAFN